LTILRTLSSLGACLGVACSGSVGAPEPLDDGENQGQDTAATETDVDTDETEGPCAFTDPGALAANQHLLQDAYGYWFNDSDDIGFKHRVVAMQRQGGDISFGDVVLDPVPGGWLVRADATMTLPATVASYAVNTSWANLTTHRCDAQFDPFDVQLRGRIENVDGMLKVVELGVAMAGGAPTTSACEIETCVEDANYNWVCDTQSTQDEVSWADEVMWTWDGIYDDFETWSRALGEQLDGGDSSLIDCAAPAGDFAEPAQLPGAQFGELLVTEFFIDPTSWWSVEECGPVEVEVYNRTNEAITLNGSSIQAADMTKIGPTAATVEAHAYLALHLEQVSTQPDCGAHDGNYPSSVLGLPYTDGLIAVGDVVRFPDPNNEPVAHWRLDPAWHDLPMSSNDLSDGWCSSATGSMGSANLPCQ
jgi:hypothetical protein